MLLLWCVVFVISLFVLVKASDFFVLAAENIGISFGFSPFIVGVMLIAVGTSLPELILSIISVLSGASEIVVGNVLGSNITNIFLILGLAAFIGKKLRIEYDLIRVDVPILLLSAFLLAFMIVDTAFTLGEAVLCLACMGIYILNTLTSPQNSNERKRAKASKKDWLFLLASPFFIFLGAKYSVSAVIAISSALSLGSEIIALSAVALGTSLPEVFVSISAVRQAKPEIAVGNIIGSNIFNTFAVTGIPALFGPLSIPEDIITFSLPLFVVATILCIIIIIDKRINRWEGCFLLVFYLFFIGRLYGWI